MRHEKSVCRNSIMPASYMTNVIVESDILHLEFPARRRILNVQYEQEADI